MTPERSPALRLYYGGTFDPVHNGHLAIACAARDALAVGVDFIPAADPPHRAPPGASAIDRVAMVRLATAGQRGLRVDLSEQSRGGRSWSIDTLRALRAQLGPGTPIAWLVGADSFFALSTWKEWRSLFDLTHFVVAPRAGHTAAEADPELREALDGRWMDDPQALRSRPAGGVLSLHQPLQWQSATELRARIAAGLDWQEMVPTPVSRYIVEHRLYGAAPEGDIIGP